MEAVHRDEGTVNQVMGDGIMALFGAPVAHEDHAVRACYAALRHAGVRRAATLRRSARSQGSAGTDRVGPHSGEVVVRAWLGSDSRMDYSAVGQTTHLAVPDGGACLSRGRTFLTAATLRSGGRLRSKVKPSGAQCPSGGWRAPVEAYELGRRRCSRRSLLSLPQGTRGLHPVRLVGESEQGAAPTRALQPNGSRPGSGVANHGRTRSRQIAVALGSVRIRTGPSRLAPMLQGPALSPTGRPPRICQLLVDLLKRATSRFEGGERPAGASREKVSGKGCWRPRRAV